MLKIQNSLLDWIGICLLALIVIEPYPLYLMHSLNAWEIGFLLKAVIMLLFILWLKIFKLNGVNKDTKIAQVVQYCTALVSIFCLLFLTFFAATIIIYFIAGSAPLKNTVELWHIVFWSLVSIILFSILADRLKRYWLVSVGILLPCIGAAIWGVIKLHS